jgi:hypothetical protein
MGFVPTPSQSLVWRACEVRKNFVSVSRRCEAQMLPGFHPGQPDFQQVPAAPDIPFSLAETAP